MSELLNALRSAKLLLAATAASALALSGCYDPPLYEYSMDTTHLEEYLPLKDILEQTINDQRARVSVKSGTIIGKKYVPAIDQYDPAWYVLNPPIYVMQHLPEHWDVTYRNCDVPDQEPDNCFERTVSIPEVRYDHIRVGEHYTAQPTAQ